MGRLLEASSSLDEGTSMMLPVTSASRVFCQPGQLVHSPGHVTGTGTAFGRAETVAARVARRVNDFMMAGEEVAVDVETGLEMDWSRWKCDRTRVLERW